MTSLANNVLTSAPSNSLFKIVFKHEVEIKNIVFGKNDLSHGTLLIR